MRGWRFALVDEQGLHRPAGERGLAGVEALELDDEQDLGDDAAEPFDERARGRHRAARGEQVVHQDDALAGLHGVRMHLDRGRPVFQRVGLGDGLARELAHLADGHERLVEAFGERGPEDEAAALDAGHEVEVEAGDRVRQVRAAQAEAGARVEDARDVPEQDPRRGEVRNLEDVVAERFHFRTYPSSRRRATPASRRMARVCSVTEYSSS